MDGSETSHRPNDALDLQFYVLLSRRTGQLEYKYECSDDSTCNDGFDPCKELKCGWSHLDYAGGI